MQTHYPLVLVMVRVSHQLRLIVYTHKLLLLLTRWKMYTLRRINHIVTVVWREERNSILIQLCRKEMKEKSMCRVGVHMSDPTLYEQTHSLVSHLKRKTETLVAFRD